MPPMLTAMPVFLVPKSMAKNSPFKGLFLARNSKTVANNTVVNKIYFATTTMAGFSTLPFNSKPAETTEATTPLSTPSIST